MFTPCGDRRPARDWLRGDRARGAAVRLSCSQSLVRQYLPRYDRPVARYAQQLTDKVP
jgi:hypothetical protein